MRHTSQRHHSASRWKSHFTLSALCVLMSACLMYPVAAVDPTDPQHDTGNSRHYGLHAEEDGTITLEGKPFYGFGLNYFGAFCHNESTGNTKPFEEGFAGIEAHGIPVVRFPLGGYYSDYYVRYDADPEGMLDQMEKVLDEAAAHHVGVIADLFWWNMALSAHVGEHRSSMGDVNSRTVAYARDYARAVVSRFADHPAIWAWEIGNEYNLDSDLAAPNGKDFLPREGLPGFPEGFKYSSYDYFNTAEMNVFMTEIAKVIREYDDYRLITTGHAALRPAAFHMQRSGRRPSKRNHTWSIDWTEDSREEFFRALEVTNPDPLNTISFHMQFGTNGSDQPAYLFHTHCFGEEIPVEELFREYVKAARQMKKALLFGEIGDMLDMENAPDCPEKFRELCDLILDSGVQVSLLWQYQDYADEKSGAKKMDVLKQLNAELTEKGMQDTSAAWAVHDADESDRTDTSVASSPESVTGETVSPDAPETGTEKSGCASAVLPASVVAGLAVSSAVLTARRRKKSRR